MRVTAAALLAAAIVVVARPAHAVEGGARDRTTTFAVAIATGGPTAPAVRCSGTLVSSNVVLTVRHCIAGTSEETARCEASFPETPARPNDFWVTAADTTAPSLGWKNVTSWVLPTPNEPCGADIALLVLSSPITPAEATPATIALTSDDFHAAALARVTGIAGFGSSSAAGTDPGVRRSRFDVPVHCVPGDPGFACGDELDLVDASEFTTGAGPCMGDSGAGAIVAGKPGTIFGVLSRGSGVAGACGAGIFERTDLSSWLVAKTVLAATPAGEIAPSWATASFPATPAVGDRCLGGDVCGAAASCVSFDDARSYVCAARCASGCADGTHCANDVCAPGAPTAAPSSGGCTTTRREPEGTVIVAVAIALVIARRRQGSSRSSSRRFRVAGGSAALGAAETSAVSLGAGTTTRGVGVVLRAGGGEGSSIDRAVIVALGVVDGAAGGTHGALAAERSSRGAVAASTPAVLRDTRTP